MELIAIYLIFAMLATIWLDVTRYLIPNWLVASVLLLYPVALSLSPQVVDWKMALAAFGLVFLVGIALHTLRLMGGGDIKLIAALCLWVGWAKLPEFIIWFGIIGGVFCLLLLFFRRIRMYFPWKAKHNPRILQHGAPLPYGVAIAGAFLWMMAQGRIDLLPAIAL